MRRPLSDFSNAAFVSSLKTEVRIPAAAQPARKECRTYYSVLGQQDDRKVTKTEWTLKELSAELTWMSSGSMKDNSPVIPPWTLADATPIKQTITQIPI